MSKNRTKKTIKAAKKAEKDAAKASPNKEKAKQFLSRQGPDEQIEKREYTNTGPADFSEPWDIDPILTVFPTNTTSRMPKMEDIPTDAQRGYGEYARWRKLFNEWFMIGLTKLDLVPREGIETRKALVHIRSIMPSFDTKHEHKEATCIYLLHKWFSDGTWVVNEERLKELRGRGF